MLNLRHGNDARFRAMRTISRRMLPIGAIFVCAMASFCGPAMKPPPASASPEKAPAATGETTAPAAAPSDTLAIAPDVSQRLGQFPRTRIDYDRSLLDERETRALGLLIEAARELDGIYARQVAE